MTVTLATDLIRLAAPAHPDPTSVVAALKPVLAQYQIDQTPERLGMFLAEWGHESNFIGVRESLTYSTAQRIFDTFNNQRRRFQSVAQCAWLVNNPVALANAVYNGRMGNRPGTNDGWLYRGNSWPQLTGRDNHAAYSAKLGVDLLGNPDLLLRPPLAAAACGVFWNDRGLNRLADAGDLIGVTQAINGGQNGAADRLARYRRLIGPLRAQAVAAPAAQRLFVNGVEVPTASAVLEAGRIQFAGIWHAITKQTQVGEKLYVQT